MDTTDMEHLLAVGFLNEIDFYFARFMMKLSESSDPRIFLAAALVSRATAQGDVCLDLSETAERPLAEEKTDTPVTAPPLASWVDALTACSAVGDPGARKPLILDPPRLYLYRYWEYETLLAEHIEARAYREVPNPDGGALKQTLDRLFPNDPGDGINWQKAAAAVAALKSLCVISGGPGTGKTTLIAKILAVLLEHRSREQEVRIALAAPTGKAAARLQEAVKSIGQTLPVAQPIRERLLSDASTIHRLLGPISGSPYFRRHRDHPLAADVVVVDEASMVDLALMSKLVQAVPDGAKLILLGDKDQLASVEAGAVMGDICGVDRINSFTGPFSARVQSILGFPLPVQGTEAIPGPLLDCVIQLQESFRFGPESGIGEAGRAISRGEGEGALEILKSEAYPDITWKTLPVPAGLPEALNDRIIDGYRPYLESIDPVEAFERFQKFRILCPLRRGPFGVDAVNNLAVHTLRSRGLLSTERSGYRGAPLLITRNDYSLSLFNGDIGLVLPDPEESGKLRTFFLSPEGTLRKFAPARLPEHEAAFAMTVHKSQGSEFDEAIVILPDRHTPVLTRELLYTAITRVRERVEIWGREEVFREAVVSRARRASGLGKALWRIGQDQNPAKRP